MDKLKNGKKFIFADIKDNSAVSSLEQSAFIILGDQGLLYKYS